jgi:hypothetical protein
VSRKIQLILPDGQITCGSDRLRLTHSGLELERTRAELRSGQLTQSRSQEVIASLRFTEAAFESTLERFRRNAITFQQIYADRHHKLWLRLASDEPSQRGRYMDMSIQTALEIASVR